MLVLENDQLKAFVLWLGMIALRDFVKSVRNAPIDDVRQWLAEREGWTFFDDELTWGGGSAVPDLSDVRPVKVVEVDGSRIYDLLWKGSAFGAQAVVCVDVRYGQQQMWVHEGEAPQFHPNTLHLANRREHLKGLRDRKTFHVTMKAIEDAAAAQRCFLRWKGVPIPVSAD